MAESMVERVARAMYERQWLAGSLASTIPDWARMPPDFQEQWLRSARAAIEAMKTPTEAMTKAGREFLFGGSRRYPASIGADGINHAEWTATWRAMIARALAEGEEGR